MAETNTATTDIKSRTHEILEVLVKGLHEGQSIDTLDMLLAVELYDPSDEVLNHVEKDGMIKFRYMLVADLFQAHHEVKFYERDLLECGDASRMKDIEEDLLPGARERFWNGCIELEDFIYRELR